MNKSGLNLSSFDTFRPAVEAIADLVCCHCINPARHDLLRKELELRGIDSQQTRQALEWCQDMSESSKLTEILSLFAPEAKGLRIPSQYETFNVSSRAWQVIQECQRRGVLSSIVAECILEELRSMDIRDWSLAEIRDFVAETCAGQAPQNLPDERLNSALKGDFGYYDC
jgi:uncharacterized protein Smg (DUF494 family)